MCGCLSRDSHWGPGLQPGYVPWLGIELATLCFTAWHSIHWAKPATASSLIYFYWSCSYVQYSESLKLSIDHDVYSFCFLCPFLIVVPAIKSSSCPRSQLKSIVVSFFPRFSDPFGCPFRKVRPNSVKMVVTAPANFQLISFNIIWISSAKGSECSLDCC